MKIKELEEINELVAHLKSIKDSVMVEFQNENGTYLCKFRIGKIGLARLYKTQEGKTYVNAVAEDQDELDKITAKCKVDLMEYYRQKLKQKGVEE